MKIPHLHKLYPRRSYDRKLLLLTVCLMAPLLYSILFLHVELELAKDAYHIAVVHKDKLLKERCPPPHQEQDRVMSWRNEAGKVECKKFIFTSNITEAK